MLGLASDLWAENIFYPCLPGLNVCFLITVSSANSLVTDPCCEVHQHPRRVTDWRVSHWAGLYPQRCSVFGHGTPCQSNGPRWGLQATEVKVEPGDWHSLISLRPDGWQALAAAWQRCQEDVPYLLKTVPYSLIFLETICFMFYLKLKMYCLTFQHISDCEHTQSYKSAISDYVQYGHNTPKAALLIVSIFVFIDSNVCMYRKVFYIIRNTNSIRMNCRPCVDKW